MLRDALERAVRRPAARTVADAYCGCWATLSSRLPVGTNVYSLEWDALILLDTCRVDALRAVAPEYDFLDAPGAIWSVGSASPEWIARTFVEAYAEEVAETAYLANNAYSKRVLADRQMPSDDYWTGWPSWSTLEVDDLAYWEPCWDFEEGFAEGHANPRSLTERAIAVGRERDDARLVVHYSPPHKPHTGRAVRENRDELREHEREPWTYLREGGSRERVWESYLDHLRYALDNVELLLENLDAERVAISADHGELFGEWGLYDHPYAVPHPNLWRVPWAETTAADEETLEPTAERRTEPARDVAEELAALGYL